MPRSTSSELSAAEAERLLDAISALESSRLSADAQAALIQSLRDRSPEMARAVDRALVGHMRSMKKGLAQASQHLDELQAVLDKLSSTPWHPGIFLGAFDVASTPAAVVYCNNSVRIVGLADGVRITELLVGDDVLLGPELNVIMQRATAPLACTGATAEFLRALPDGRLLLRHRDEEVVVRAAGALASGELSVGDRVRWSHAAEVAFERVERPRDSHLFLEETPSEGFEQIGGLDRQIARLLEGLDAHLRYPEVVSRYQLSQAVSVLLAGPPGVGKTMIARAIANWLGRHSRSGQSRFMSIKPGELHSMWYGQSESNYREAFRIARQAGETDPSTPVVMFFDEVDAIGAARGHDSVRVDDRVLTSFMAELDGLKARGNILIVAATNRRDRLDPALARPGRLGGLVIDIPRPGMAAAAAVFEKHLPATIPYATDGTTSETDSRQTIIDAAVSALYAPNGAGDLASIMFRDSTRRIITARDLISGAHIANIARTAIERACYREIGHGAPGLTPTDVLETIEEELSSAVAGLTPANCHAFVSNLPQDQTVARIDPLRRVPRHRFLSVA